jgi:phosphate-selective porin OprO and OprP
MRTLTTAARTALFTTLAAVGLTASLSAQSASASDIEALREQIRQLDQKLRILERKGEIAAETAAADAKKLPKITASEGRFEIASSDGANSIRLRGLVQGDARFYFDDANAAQDRFVLRRARLIFEGKFSDRFTYVVQPEFAGSTVSILDANVSTAILPDVLSVRVGRFKTPVGLEQLQSDPVAFFNERSIATNLAPNRDVAVEVSGAVLKKTLGYQVSVTNGVIDGGNSNPASDNLEGDFTLAGRLFYTPFVNNKDSAFQGLGFGIAGATGNYSGAQLNAYRTDGQQTFFSYRGATVADGTASVISPQLYFYKGPVGILAEYFSNSAELRNGANGRDITNTAYNFSVGYVLTGEDSTYRGVTPQTTFNPSAGTWGAFEVVARIAHVDIDNDVFAGAGTSLSAPSTTAAGVTTLNATEVTSYGLGLNWYLSRTVRAGFNVFKSDFKAANSAVASPGTVLSDDELAFISRVQVSF